ncbi:GntR family transcriptional regulator [Chelatococcus reniformis]|jgi:DNA-binding GntR family transcriptional regulator|uniref:GntR family transcriptional regulator n=1 Tax=Chelatococcus reniformis TaxID=1494448 RepID=A0A916U710_9HYPH|nr:GntR family transcriptional regulator [Chelatococcus reniformis]GGC62203.1 GntR family transcriptional regulator [Chelatococcus reniformis]
MGAAPKKAERDVRAGETVSDVAYGRIRADILFGRLKPRERLRLEIFSQRYGTSVSTMRELLSRLGSEGLIVAEGQRGFEVAPVSPVEFREVAAMRLLLEQHALTQSFQAGDLDWEARVVAAHHKLAVTEGRMLRREVSDPEVWKDCDRAFHHALISACGSRVLLQTYAAIYDKYLRYQMIAVVFRGEIAAREHAELLACALSRDADRASRILDIHINSCVDHALRDDPPGWA